MLDKVAQPGALSIKARASFSGIRLGIPCNKPLIFFIFPDYLVIRSYHRQKKESAPEEKEDSF